MAKKAKKKSVTKRVVGAAKSAVSRSHSKILRRTGNASKAQTQPQVFEAQFSPVLFTTPPAALAR
jgi:hypothetical protein